MGPDNQEQDKQKGNQVDKTYIKSKKKWKDFKLDENIIQALQDQNKNRPTKVQEQALNIALNPDRKKFNLLIRAMNGSGKTLAFLLPMLNALEPGLKTAEDKTIRGKVMENEIYHPQGVIIIQNILLQSQLMDYLVNFQDYGKNNNVEKLNFTIGKLNNDGHTPGDIILCMPKSFLNRHARGNMKLEQCKFVAIDQIDDIFKQDKQSLGKILEILTNDRPNVITCSATMERSFLEFYKSCVKDYITLNLNAELEKETGEKITLEGVKNYYHKIDYTDSKTEMFNYVLNVVFKELYRDTDKKKPQAFMFFNSADDIYEFEKLFDALASDSTTDQSEYLKDISKAALSAKTYKDGKKTDMEHSEKEQIMTKFKNNETNVLMCTNIMARGIDIRNAVFVLNMGPPKLSKKDDEIDVDIYLHRVGRTGRHNDKGVALTLGNPNEIEMLVKRVSSVHKIEIVEMPSIKEVVDEVHKCIEANG